MNDPIVAELERLNYVLTRALASADGKGLRTILESFADLEIEHAQFENAQQEDGNHPKIETEMVIQHFQAAIRSIADVISYSGREPSTALKSNFMTPLIFGTKWNGSPPKSFSKQLASENKIWRAIWIILIQNPETKKTSIANEIAETYQITLQRALSMVERVMADYQMADGDQEDFDQIAPANP